MLGNDMDGNNNPRALTADDGLSWGAMTFRPATEHSHVKAPTLSHSDSRLFVGMKSTFGEEYTNANPPVANAPFEHRSSPPIPIAAPVFMRQSARDLPHNHRSATPGASVADTIDVDSLPAAKPPRSTGKGKKAIRGRSLGDRSTRPIKQLRMQAEADNLDAALKLGWSVERLTRIYNRKKMQRGVIVTSELQPIDDEELLARIEDRKHNARVATQRRTNRLKERANNGDFEAAKKLGLGRKTMEDMFPQIAADRLGDQLKQEQLSPTEPRNFDEDWRRSIEQRPFEDDSRGPSVAATEMELPTFKRESAETSLRPLQHHGQFGDARRTAIRDSFGRLKDIPAFSPFPEFTPTATSAMPRGWPNALPPNTTPNHGHLPSAFPLQMPTPDPEKGLLLVMKLNVRIEFEKALKAYARSLVEEVEQEIYEYQASQRRFAQVYVGRHNQYACPTAGREDQAADAANGKEWTFIQQTGLESDMQMLE